MSFVPIVENLLLWVVSSILLGSHEKNKDNALHKHSHLLNDIIHNHDLLRSVLVVDTPGQITRKIPLWLNWTGSWWMMSKNWESNFLFVKVSKLPRSISDHNPLIMDTEITDKKPLSSFHFKNGWLTHPEFTSIVDKIWNKPCRDKSPIDKIQQKLKLCKQHLKGWDWHLKGT